jgi:hypothetical protein
VVTGGDWYDAFLNPDQELSLVIGDVAGHDRTAAAAMGQTRNLLCGLTFGVGDLRRLAFSASITAHRAATGAPARRRPRLFQELVLHPQPADLILELPHAHAPPGSAARPGPDAPAARR